MRVTTFQTVAHRLAATIGKTRNVQVVFGGTKAWVRPNKIHLPALPAGTVMSIHEADVMRGFLDHEVGHVVYTDFDAVDANTKRLKTIPSLKTIWNWVEDPWQENRTIAELPGSDQFLKTTHAFMDSEAAKRHVGENQPTFAELALRLTYRELWSFRGLDRDMGTNLTLEDLGLRNVRDLIHKDFPDCKSTADNIAMAEKIRDLLEEAIEDFEPEPEDGEGDESDETPGDGEGSPGEGEGEGAGSPGEGEGSPGEGGEGDAGDNTPELGGKLGKGGKDTRDRRPTEAGDLEEEGDELGDTLGTSNLLKRLLQSIAKRNGLDPNGYGNSEEDDDTTHTTTMKWSGSEYQVPAGTHNDRIFVPSKENMRMFEQERASLSSDISTMKKALTILLRSQERRAWTRGLDEGVFDDEALTDVIATGSTRPFKQRRMRTYPNTVVQVMLDLSSSMSSQNVRHSGIMLAEALVGLPKIKVGVAGFTTNGHRYDEYPGCGRLDALDILLFKGFDETYKASRARLGAVRTYGLTPLGEGFAFGFEALVVRPELRKVLIVVTDGSPCYHHGGNTNAPHNDFVLVRQTAARAKDYGVETYGLSIGGQAGLRPHVDNFLQIGSSTQLAQALFEITKRVVVPL